MEFEHDLTTLVSGLTEKIMALTEAQMRIQGSIAQGDGTSQNNSALTDVTASLRAAHDALAALQKSCCNGQNCKFQWT